MKETARMTWLDMADAMYDDIGRAPEEHYLLLSNLMRAYIWPLYYLAD